MLLTIRQASDALGKTQRQIRYLIQQGELKAEKWEGRWMIDSAWLMRERSLPINLKTAIQPQIGADFSIGCYRS